MKIGGQYTYSLGPFGVIWFRASCKVGAWVWFRGRQRYWSFQYAQSTV